MRKRALYREFAQRMREQRQRPTCRKYDAFMAYLAEPKPPGVLSLGISLVPAWIERERWRKLNPTVDLEEIMKKQKQVAPTLSDPEPPANPFLEKLRSLQFAPSAMKGGPRRAEPGKKNMFGEVIDG